MKKSLLLSALFISAMSIYGADFNYGVAGDEFTGYGLQQAAYNYSAAIEVPENVAASMTGSQITEVSFGFHSGLAKAATIFLTYDLNGKPFYEQAVKGLKVGKYNDFELTTPYTIEGKKFYIGYTYRASSSSGYPIGFDETAGFGNEAFCHLKTWPDNGTGEWRSASELGVLALRAKVSGDKLPSLGAVPKGIIIPEGVSPNKNFSYTITVKNLSTGTLNDVDIYSTVDGKAMETANVAFADAVAAGDEGKVTGTAISDHDTLDLIVKGFISKANGEDNPWSKLPASGKCISSDYVFPRIVVAEEFTGTDCGYCPRGIVSLAILSEKYPDTFIPIEVHNYRTSDPMYCSSYVSWANRWAGGAPTTVLDRDVSFSPDPSTIENYYKTQAGLVRYAVRPEVTYANDTYTSLKVKTYTSFGEAYSNHSMALSFVLIQNNMGPYSQANNYAGGQPGTMGGWEDKSSRVPWIYNDVARQIFDWQGRPNTIPASISQGEVCEYETTLPISAPTGRVHADTEVVVLLINQSNGQIMTAGRAHITNPYVDGVSEITSRPAIVRPGEGEITIEGEFERADIYTLDGLHMASLTGEGTVNVPGGIYVVRTVNGEKASISKIMVK